MSKSRNSSKDDSNFERLGNVKSRNSSKDDSNFERLGNVKSRLFNIRVLNDILWRSMTFLWLLMTNLWRLMTFLWRLMTLLWRLMAFYDVILSKTCLEYKMFHIIAWMPLARWQSNKVKPFTLTCLLHRVTDVGDNWSNILQFRSNNNLVKPSLLFI